MKSNLQTILLVEDEPDLRVLLSIVITNVAELGVRVQVVQNGLEALNYLKGRDFYSNREKYPLPVLILTDINMPLMSGFELLTWVKQYSQLKHLLVVVMSSSNEPNQIKEAMSLGASGYFFKGSAIDNLIYILKYLLL